MVRPRSKVHRSRVNPEDSTPLRESASRKKIDLQLTNLGWITDEESPDCNVSTERALTQGQRKLLAGKPPDYVLYELGTKRPLGILEAKAAGEDLDRAVQDAVTKYSRPLSVPIVIASDGTFVRTWHVSEGRELALDGDPVRTLLAPGTLLKFAEQGASVQTTSKVVKHSREELIRTFEWANDLLRQEGLRDLARFVEFSNVLFLKIVSELEVDRASKGQPRRLEDKYCWNTFYNLPAEAMMSYVNDTVLPHLVDRYNHSGDVFQPHLQMKNADTLKQLVDRLSRLTLINTESEVKGDAFEYFLKDLGKSNDFGEYFTPRHIVRLMVRLIDPKFGETVYDPAAGTGGFIIEAFRNVRASCHVTPETEPILREKTIYASELTDTARVAKMNMILADDGHTNIFQRDTLENPVRERFDVILTNFPFSQTTRFGKLYGLNSDDGNAVFLKHIIDALKPGGRAGVVTFQGVLHDTQAKVYEEIRRLLVDTCELQAVIKLHNFVFRPYSGSVTSILIFKKGGSSKDVWFFDVQDDGLVKTSSKKGRRPGGPNDLDLLERLWATKATSDRSWSVPADAIRHNHYVLDADSYKPKVETTPSVPHRPILDLCDTVGSGVKNFPGSRRYLSTGKVWGDRILGFDVVTFSKRPDRANVEVRPGDVLFAKMRETNKSALITEDLSDILVSTGFTVLRVKDSRVLLPEFLALVVSAKGFRLAKDNVSGGSTQRSMNESGDLPKLTVPLPSLAVQRAIVARLQPIRAKSQRIDDLTDAWDEAPISATPFNRPAVEVELGSLLAGDPQNGLWKPLSDYGDDGVPIVRIDSIRGMRIDPDRLEKIRVSPAEQETYGLSSGDVVINRVNSRKFIGKCAVYRGGPTPCLFESNNMRIRMDLSRVIPEYLVYFLSSPRGREQLQSVAKPSVNQVSINQGHVRHVRVPLPTIEDQKEVLASIERDQAALVRLQEIRGELDAEGAAVLAPLF